MTDPLKLAVALKETAPAIEAFSSHRLGAELMRAAATELIRLAPYDPDRRASLMQTEQVQETET